MSDDFVNITEVAKARKRYRCYLCHEPIEPGEPYVRASGKTDGEMYSEANHPECFEKANDPDGDWDWEECFSGDMERPKKGAEA